MFCPFCVYDDVLDMTVRMRQFCTNESFRLHLTGHYNEVVLNPGAQRECPVPSCGTHTFDALELLTHMVVFHRVPICGSDKHTNFRRLHLPNADDVQPVMDTEPVDLAHLNQQAPSESGPTPSGSTVPAPVVKKKRRYTQANPFQAVELLHKCEKHRAQFHDIREHIPAHCNEIKLKIRDTTMKRGRFGPFYNFAEWSRTAPPFVYLQPSGDAAEKDDQDGEPETSEPGPSKKPRVEAELFQFKCSGCKKEFKDVEKHLAAIRKNTSKCKKNRFRVRQQDGSFGSETTLASYRASMAPVISTT